MTKTLSAYEARTKLGEIMNEVYYNDIEVIVERMGKPMIKIISVRKEKNQQANREDLIKKYAGIWAGKKGEVIEKYAKKFRKEAKLIRDDNRL